MVDSLKNIIMMAVFFAVILFVLLGLGWKTVAFIFFYLFALLTTVSVIAFIVALIGTISAIINNRKIFKYNSGNEIRPAIVNAVYTLGIRLIEEVVTVIMAVVLYAIFYVPGILIKG